jgi:hypothetical protein
MSAKKWSFYKLIDRKQINEDYVFKFIRGRLIIIILVLVLCPTLHRLALKTPTVTIFWPEATIYGGSYCGEVFCGRCRVIILFSLLLVIQS